MVRAEVVELVMPEVEAEAEQNHIIHFQTVLQPHFKPCYWAAELQTEAVEVAEAADTIMAQQEAREVMLLEREGL